MVTKFGLLPGFACALFIAAAVSPAVAQAPTVAGVHEDLQISCVAGANGLVVNQTGCIAAVARAITAANALATLGETAPQVDIGCLVGQIMINFPALAQQVIDLVNESGNAAIALGISNCLGENWVGPRPIVSPA